MAFQETIKLVFGHNIVSSHLPTAIPTRALSEIQLAETVQRKEIGKFGLFDVASPNFSSYYPEVTEDDLSPKDGEFIMPTYRALSEVIVHRSWNPVDFSKKNVLKNSASLLVGQTIYPNHEAVVGNELGSVVDVAWEEEYTANGIKIPAGINARMKIDGKSNPKIARGILMDPPSIHSTSATVRFLWERSHESLSEEEFWRKLGTFDKDGVLIRKMATKVINYPELSLVSHGADPFAQKIGNNGKIINPIYAETANNSAEAIKNKKESNIFFFDFKTDLISNSDEGTTPESINNNLNTDSNMKEVILLLATQLGLQAADLPEEEAGIQTALTAKLKELQDAAKADNEAVTNLQAEVDRLKPLEQELTALKESSKDLTGLASFKEAQTTAARTRVEAIYNKLHGAEGGTTEARELIKNGDYIALAALEKEYAIQLDAKFPASCTKCGSTEVSRASAKVNNPTPPAAPKTQAQAIDKILESKNSQGVKAGLFAAEEVK